MAAAVVASAGVASDAAALRVRTRSLIPPPGMRLRCTARNRSERKLAIDISIRTRTARIVTDFIAIEWADERAGIPAYVVAESGNPAARYCVAVVSGALPRDLGLTLESFDPLDAAP